MDLLTVKNLALGYEGKTVLRDVNFSVEAGNYLCILGENGSGKTTLMKTLLGLIPAISGEITFGEGLTYRDVGYMPQQTNVQRDFPASVEEIVRSGSVGKMGWRPFYSREEKERANRSLELLGIADLRKKCYRELSGGQQQRVLLARALTATEKLILLDEPVAGLDPAAQEEMYGAVMELNRQGTTVIMISHDVRAALRHATHVLHVGETAFFGTVAEYEKFTEGGNPNG